MGLSKTAAQKRFLSSCILMLMALAFAAKSVLPAGFMPSVTPDGYIQMVVCSGMGEKTVLVPADDLPATDHQETAPDKNCAYQFLAGHKSLTAPLETVIALPASGHAGHDITDDNELFTQPVFSQTARGPPLFA